MLKAMHYRRLAVMTTWLTAGFLFHEARLFYLQVLRHDDLGAITSQYDRYWHAPDPWRGEIRARKGEPLALTFPVKTVYADLTVCSNRPDDCARIIAASLSLNPEAVRNTFRTALSSTTPEASPQALRLKVGVLDGEWCCLTNALAREFSSLPPTRLTRLDRARLKKLRSRSVFAVDDQIRIYTPAAFSLGHVLGFTRTRDSGHGLQGVTGIESYFNTILGGAPGVCLSQKDATDKELAFRRGQFVPPRPGNHLLLTIDAGLQSLCYRALADACARHSPSNATVMIVQPQTGEILAWASWPPFNLSQPADSPPRIVPQPCDCGRPRIGVGL